MKFIDLFAGLGGFHLALASLGHECVLACEKEKDLRDLYRLNFGIVPRSDLRAVESDEIPDHDILCAGFPCQPFSKAGAQLGFNCPVNGDLFAHVLRILEDHQPEFVLLENVPNFERHDHGDTITEVCEQLESLGYDVDYESFSPHHFGVPQIRNRIFIVGRLESLNGFSWPDPEPSANLSIESVLDADTSAARQISEQVKDCIQVWQEFLDEFPAKEQLPSFPIWSMEFGATYPFEDETPFACGETKLQGYRGSHGIPLRGMSMEEMMAALPSNLDVSRSL